MSWPTTIRLATLLAASVKMLHLLVGLLSQCRYLHCSSIRQTRRKWRVWVRRDRPIRRPRTENWIWRNLSGQYCAITTNIARSMEHRICSKYNRLKTFIYLSSMMIYYLLEWMLWFLTSLTSMCYVLISWKFDIQRIKRRKSSIVDCFIILSSFVCFYSSDSATNCASCHRTGPRHWRARIASPIDRIRRTAKISTVSGPPIVMPRPTRGRSAVRGMMKWGSTRLAPNRREPSGLVTSRKWYGKSRRISASEWQKREKAKSW